MVEISLSGSGEGSGWVTAPGYSTAAFSAPPILGLLTSRPQRARSGNLFVFLFSDHGTNVQSVITGCL